jgi:short-subunit dehydrogenase
MTERPRGIALVTGASSGIGAEFARQLAARGHDLVLVARDRERLEALAAELRSAHGVDAQVFPADLLDPAQLALVEARVTSVDAPVEYLVNNAGFGLRGEFDEMSIEDELSQFDLLARVPLVLTHAALGRMLPAGSGTIVTVASTAGLLPLGSYSAAKGWAILFSRWANAYYRSRGVTVSAVAPGFVRTEFHERMNVSRESMAPRWAWLDASRVVRDALRDIDRGKAVSVSSLRYKAALAVAVPLRPLVMRAVRARGRRRGRS